MSLPAVYRWQHLQPTLGAAFPGKKALRRILRRRCFQFSSSSPQNPKHAQSTGTSPAPLTISCSANLANLSSQPSRTVLSAAPKPTPCLSSLSRVPSLPTDSLRVSSQEPFGSSALDFPRYMGMSTGASPLLQPPSPGTTFAQLLQSKQPQTAEIMHDDIVPVKKGDSFAVPIDEQFYQQRVRQCEDSLIGRLIRRQALEIG